MEIEITKGPRSDRIAVLRGDGSRAGAEVPHKGRVPHDAVHYFVESGLGFAAGFWGMVAAGRDPDSLAGLAREAGHPSAARGGAPDASIVELLQAERLVECFEADLWSGGGDNDALLAMARSGWEASHVAEPQCNWTGLDRVRDALAEFACEWMDADPGYVARLAW